MLEKSMERYGFYEGNPITCVRNNEGKLQITQGHHRFHVAKKLGLSIWFLVAPRNIPLFETEASSHSWNVRDFAVARCRKGEKAPLEALEYHQKTGIPLSCSIGLVGGLGASSGSVKSRELKSGKFKVGDMTHANEVASIIEHCKQEKISFALNTYFVQAISKCLFVPDFDAEYFRYKVSKYPELMRPQRGVDEYLRLIEEVYNYKQSKKKIISLAYYASEAAMERKRTFYRNRSA
jgi:hypothetical protein